ncbi:MAG TPA: 7-cyano-7-deazaguanine synthase QueC [Deltaproteobacteria bacterium]|nr:7-cyano-7-deazaguanine synthase QueC [Deltaproteobacteria bacterium]
MTLQKKAIILLSGGIDSATTMAIARQMDFDAHALSFRYGQRNIVELEAASRVAQHFGVVKQLFVDINLRLFGGGALTADVDVPKNRDVAQMAKDIPITYVPARNTIFLSYALAWAEVLGSSDIFIGVNAVDYSGYPDCRPEYIAAFENMANLATRASVSGADRLKIHTPLIEMSKARIIQKGRELGVDFGLTFSCYDPNEYGLACGQCDSCLLRLKGFNEAGLEDPIKYVKYS